MRFAVRRQLAYGYDFHVPATAQDVDGDRVSIAFAGEVDRSVPNFEVANANLRQLLRQSRVMQINARLAGADLHAQAGLQKHEHRSRRPGLRRTCNRVERWPLARTSAKTADQLRKTVEIDFGGEIEQPRSDAQSKVLFTSSQSAKSDEGVIVRPHGSVVVRHGVVSALAGHEGAHAPSREESRRNQHLTDGAALRIACDTREQALAGVGASHAALFFLAIQRQREHADFVRPERGLELGTQVRGLCAQPVGKVVVPKPIGYGGYAVFGGVYVGLHFAQRDRSNRQAAIAIED